jgi:hypothetical protein
MLQRFSPSRLIPLLVALTLGLALSLAALAAGQAQAAAVLLSPLLPGDGPGVRSSDIFAHLAAGRRLHLLVDGPAGAFAAPDGDWAGGAGVVNGAYTATQSYALRAVPVYAFRTSVRDENDVDVAWEFAAVAQILANEYRLPYRVLDEAALRDGALTGNGVLLLPAFNDDYAADVVAALTPAGLTALHDFVTAGGTVYAQGTGAYLLEAAGLLPPGTVNLNVALELPGGENMGIMHIEDPTNLLTFNWQSDQLWLSHDPVVTANPPLVAVATYTNTLGGPQPAILYGESGQGRIVVVAGHATSAQHRDQLPIFLNGLLSGMAERAELYGRAIQTYDPTPGPTVIPAYEANIPISVTLCVGHYWQGATLENARLTEQVQPGFHVDPASIVPLPATVEITAANGLTITTLTWDFGALAATPPCLHYTAYTERDALAAERVTFSRGALVYADGARQVAWPHRDFILEARLAARLYGEHDKEDDRFYFLPEEGVILDEFIFLENKEDSWAHGITLTRYIPLIVPIVGLEDQRQPLATNAGETVWISNTLFMFENGDYLPPENLTSITDTLDLNDWDGHTFVTMTTPGGYHIDPLPTNAPLRDGFFVTIPITYAHAITVTADHQLLLPAIAVTWDLGAFPPLHWELPALRYGIQSGELFGRSVSFTGDPQVGTLVVDATGGSVYTGLGSDPLVHREFLADVIVEPPQAPITTSITYQDIWSRTHAIPIRAGFYDLFNWASCACGPGSIGERHQWINVTFGIWVDTDGDGSRETLLTDFDALKGYMPQRVQGDLDILIKTRNLGQPVGALENFIESRLFRGIGFTITPRNGTWENSYTAERSQLISQTVDGGYQYLIFQQRATAPFATDSIIIHATIDADTRNFERLLKLHDGATFGYRQAYAGPGQYEIHDTHVQGVLGARSDPIITARVNPISLSTIRDTFFLDYELRDPYELHDTADRGLFQDGIFFQSWGFGESAATTYVGGRDGRELLLSLLNLGDRTWLRLEVNNNTGADWTNVRIIPLPPAGITATALFTQNVPPALWPDMPFLNVSAIPDTTFGIYYFELQIDPAVTHLQGRILEIPIQFQADGAPADFGLPPAKLAIRNAAGEAPRYTSGLAHSLEITDTLAAHVTPTLALLLTDAEMSTLNTHIAADLDASPRGTSALTYFLALSGTAPTLNFNYTDTLLHFNLPITLPVAGASGRGESVHAVLFNQFAVLRGGRYQVSAGALLTGRDDFGMIVTDTAAPQFVEANGAGLQAFYVVDGITRTLTGEALDFLTWGEDNEVEVRFTVGNLGNDVAFTPTLSISFSPAITLTVYPENVQVISNTLLWQTEDLAPGAQTSILVTFFVPTTATRHIGQPAESLLAIHWTDADFFNNYAKQWIFDERIGGPLSLPINAVPYLVHLPAIFHTPPATFTSIQVGEAIAERFVEATGEIFYQTAITLPVRLPTTGRFYFSSQSDSAQPAVVDDLIAMVADAHDIFTYHYSSKGRPEAAVIEIPREILADHAGESIVIEYRDVFGWAVEATPIWLIWIP